MLSDFLPVACLCRIVEEYAREFKGLLRIEMPEIMDLGGRRRYPPTLGSIATANGQILYTGPRDQSEGVMSIDPQHGTAKDLDFALDSRMVALDEFTLATYYVGTVNVWDMRTNSRVFTKEYAEPSELANLAALPRNRLAVFGSGMVVVWDWSTGHQVCELHVKHVKCVAGFGSETLVVGVHNLLRVYKDGQLVLKRRGHDRNIRQLLALPSNLLASGGQDANIRIWNVESLQCLHVFSGVKWGTMDLLGDGSLVTVSLDGHHVLVYRDGLLVHDLAYFGSPMVALKAMSNNRLVSCHMYGDVCVWH